MNENGFNGYLATDLRNAGLELTWKINDRFAGGTPDFFVEGINQDLWMESKYISPFPKRDSTLIDLTNPKQYLSKLQLRWLARRQRNRGDGAVVVGSEAGCLLFLDSAWLEPFTVGYFREHAIDRKALAELIAETVRSPRYQSNA